MNGTTLGATKCLERECLESFKHTRDLRFHLEHTHQWRNDIENHSFNSYKDFEEWLEKEELISNVQYNRSGCKQTSHNKAFQTIYFDCVRSGKSISKSNGLRAPRHKGSCKIGQNCTSQMVVKHDRETDICSMKYFKNHYGHESELKYMRLPKTAKEAIACKLNMGISTTSIIKSIRENADQQTQRRLDFITRTDVNNIRRQYNIDLTNTASKSKDDENSLSKNKAAIEEIINLTSKICCACSKVDFAIETPDCHEQLTPIIMNLRSCLTMADQLNASCKEVELSEPANKKIKLQETILSTKKKKSAELPSEMSSWKNDHDYCRSTDQPLQPQTSGQLSGIEKLIPFRWSKNIDVKIFLSCIKDASYGAIPQTARETKALLQDFSTNELISRFGDIS